MAEREVGRNEQTNAKEFDVAAVPREEKGRSSFVGRKNMESLSRDRPVAGGVKVHPDYRFSIGSAGSKVELVWDPFLPCMELSALK